MLPLALLLALVPVPSYAFALLQTETRLNLEGGSHMDRMHPNGDRYWSWMQDYYAYGPNYWKELAGPSRGAMNMTEYTQPLPPHRSWKLIVPVVVIVVAVAVAHCTCLYRMSITPNQATSQPAIEATLSERDRRKSAQFGPAVIKLYPVWIVILMQSIAVGVVGPMDQYINLDYFANQVSDAPSVVNMVMCEFLPGLPKCKDAVRKNLHLTMIHSTAAPFVSFFLGPALGALSDSFGRRPIIRVVAFLLVITPLMRSCHVLFGLDLRVAFCLQPLNEIPLVGVLAAYFSDLVDDPRVLATMFGLMGGIGCVGRVVGMLTAGHLSIKASFMIYLILQLLTTLYVFCGLPESLEVSKRAPFKWDKLKPGFNMDVLFRTPLRRRLAAIVVFSEFCDAGYVKILPSFYVQYLDWGKDINYTYCIIGICSCMVWMGLLLPVAIKFLGETGTMALGRWSCEFVVIGVLLGTKQWHQILCAGLFNGPVMLVFPVIQALKSRAVEPHEQGRAQSSLNSLKAIFSALGPPVFGAVFESAHGMVHTAWKIGLLATAFNFACLASIFLLPPHLKELNDAEQKKFARRPSIEGHQSRPPIDKNYRLVRRPWLGDDTKPQNKAAAEPESAPEKP